MAGASRQKGQVLYELHVGTFTPEGTYAAAARKLPLLKELGVTTLELMPLHTCAGRFNWGYDGVNLFAPYPAYGSPDELRRLVDEAHRLGLGIIAGRRLQPPGAGRELPGPVLRGLLQREVPQRVGRPHQLR